MLINNNLLDNQQTKWIHSSWTLDPGHEGIMILQNIRKCPPNDSVKFQKTRIFSNTTSGTSDLTMLFAILYDYNNAANLKHQAQVINVTKLRNM